ncbi:steroid 21-hydroxylase isoform X2 [Carettochelys insculpta]|uniref:steroid 21-hydroxylase isoform X2 n=1 Tax=Carettochelys insculpta TaxID=44489 RepID=UPI003EB85A02
MPAPGLLLALLALLVLAWALLWGRREAYRKPGLAALPGPWALPLVGGLPHILHPELPLHMLELARRYGPMYRLRLGSKDMVVLNTVDGIRQALSQKWSDFAGRPPSFVGDLISLGGHDLSLGDFTPSWRQQRKAAHSALICVQRLHMDAVLGAQAAALCQMPDEAAIHDIHSCIQELVELWGQNALRALDVVPLLQLFPNRALRRLLQHVRFRDDFVRAQIQKHQELLHPEGAPDIVAHLLGKQQEARGDLAPEQVHMAIVDLFVGGTETTAALLTWAVAFLLHYPEVQDRIYEELQRVLGPQQPPTYGDRDRLPLLSATINETLRLRPTAPLALPHSATRDTSLLGMAIPKGTILIPNLFAAHHDEAVWSHPLEFRPERFLEAEKPWLAQRQLLPFSCGARACLGETLARAELFVFLGHLLREFRMEPPTPGALPPLQGLYGVVMRCRPFRVRLLPRAPPL